MLPVAISVDGNARYDAQSSGCDIVLCPNITKFLSEFVGARPLPLPFRLIRLCMSDIDVCNPNPNRRGMFIVIDTVYHIFMAT